MSGLPWPPAFVDTLLAELRTFEGQAMRPAVVHAIGLAARTVVDIHRRGGDLGPEVAVRVGDSRDRNGAIRAIHLTVSEPWRKPFTVTLGNGMEGTPRHRLEELRERSAARAEEANRLRSALEHEARVAFRQWEMLERRAGGRSPYAREAWRRWVRVRKAIDPSFEAASGADDA